MEPAIRRLNSSQFLSHTAIKLFIRPHGATRWACEVSQVSRKLGKTARLILCAETKPKATHQTASDIPA